MAGDPGSGNVANDGTEGGSATASSSAASPKLQRQRFRDYGRVLRDHRNFRYLWIAETVDNVGSWLSYVATLELASHFSGGSGLALSGVLLIRFLPSLLLAPLCGVVADRVNRVRVLIVAAVLDACVVALLALVQHPSQAPLLYVLLTLQFSAAAFYEPARKALVPVVVPPHDLHLATTIDSFAWSITGAVGASLGGVVASRLGQQACFLVDSCTYLVAAWCAMQLPTSLGAPDAGTRQLRKERSLRQVELPALAGVQTEVEEEGAEEGAVVAVAAHEEGQPLGLGSGAGQHAAAPVGSSRGSGGSPSRGRGGALLAAAASAVAEGVRALKEGWCYVSSRENTDVAALVLMKCAAALVWGAVDLLNVYFSEMSAMQWLGDASTTLGLIFATVGLGCFVGPILMNRFVPPQPPALRWGVAASYLLFFAGLLLMLLAPNIVVLLISTFVRAMGSATLWVYSTLLMQQRVPNELLGRMSAIESAMFTITETVSSLFGGAAFDVLHLSLPQLLLILSAAAGVEAAGWTAYAYLANRSRSSRSRPGGSGGGSGGAYVLVAQEADDEGPS